MRNDNATLKKIWEKYFKENYFCKEVFQDFYGFLNFMNENICDICVDYDAYLKLSDIIKLIEIILDYNSIKNFKFYIIRIGVEDMDYSILIIDKNNFKICEIPYLYRNCKRKMLDIFFELINTINIEEKI